MKSFLFFFLRFPTPAPSTWPIYSPRGLPGPHQHPILWSLLTCGLEYMPYLLNCQVTLLNLNSLTPKTQSTSPQLLTLITKPFTHPKHRLFLRLNKQLYWILYLPYKFLSSPFFSLPFILAILSFCQLRLLKHQSGFHDISQLWTEAQDGGESRFRAWWKRSFWFTDYSSIYSCGRQWDHQFPIYSFKRHQPVWGDRLLIKVVVMQV